MQQCPICDSIGEPIRVLKSDFIKDQLQKYYNERLPEEIVFNDYEMMRCKKCTLEYAIPPIPGDEHFYRWIARHHPDYYPNERWEWLKVFEKLRESKVNTVNLLEIGCGSGNFLERVGQIRNIKYMD